MNKMNCILLTVFIVLSAYCSSGMLDELVLSVNTEKWIAVKCPNELFCENGNLQFLPHIGCIYTGYALKCYTCDNSPVLCSTNGTCIPGDDSCLQIRLATLKTYACWKRSRCNMNEIADVFAVDNFDFFCCQKDFCNESPAIMVSKTAFSIASVMTMMWMLCF